MKLPIHFIGRQLAKHYYQTKDEQLIFQQLICTTSTTWCTVGKSTDGKSFSIKATENKENKNAEKATIAVTAGDAKAISFSATQDKAYSIHIAGSEEQAGACYWKNGEKISISNVYSFASCIFVQ